MCMDCVLRIASSLMLPGGGGGGGEKGEKEEEKKKKRVDLRKWTVLALKTRESWQLSCLFHCLWGSRCHM